MVAAGFSPAVCNGSRPAVALRLPQRGAAYGAFDAVIDASALLERAAPGA
jgi:hypothetical protein